MTLVNSLKFRFVFVNIMSSPKAQISFLPYRKKMCFLDVRPRLNMSQFDPLWEGAAFYKNVWKLTTFMTFINPKFSIFDQTQNISCNYFKNDRLRTPRVQLFWWHLPKRDFRPGTFEPYTWVWKGNKNKISIQNHLENPNHGIHGH